MLPQERTPTHPGEILREEFLNPLGLTQVTLAEHLGVPVQRINEIVKGKRGVTPETAWLLAGAFGTTPEFWLNLQANHDLVKARPARHIQQLEAADSVGGSIEDASSDWGEDPAGWVREQRRSDYRRIG